MRPPPRRSHLAIVPSHGRGVEITFSRDGKLKEEGARPADVQVIRAGSARIDTVQARRDRAQPAMSEITEPIPVPGCRSVRAWWTAEATHEPGSPLGDREPEASRFTEAANAVVPIERANTPR